MTPIVLAITIDIDFDNFISSPLSIIPLVFDDRTTRFMARCPSQSPFVHAIGHVFFKFFWVSGLFWQFAAKHTTKIKEYLSICIAVAEAM